MSVTSGAWLSKLELNEKGFFFCLGPNKINSSNKMNLNFCRVVLLDIASRYFLLYVYILLYIYKYIRLFKRCSYFSVAGKKNFPKFIHLLFFPSPTELLQIMALPPDLEIGSCLFFELSLAEILFQDDEKVHVLSPCTHALHLLHCLSNQTLKCIWRISQWKCKPQLLLSV